MFNRLPTHAFSCRAALICVAALTSALASAQGMLVRPMSVETTARPGQVVDLDFEVQNTLPNQSLSVDGELLFLTQGDAGWMATAPGELSEAERKRYSSALPWLKLAAGTIELPALQTKTFKIRMQVPSTARGFYSAAVTFKNKPMNGGNGIGVVLRFLVPILVQVEGSVPKRKALLEDPQVISVLPSENGPGSTFLGLKASNVGEGLTRVAGSFDLYGQIGGQWVKVSSAEVAVRRIIPGGFVRLSSTLPKRIPKGHYKMVGNFLADGQRLPQFVQELDVAGDSGIGTLQPDIPLVISPALLEMDAQGGSVRTATISLRNPGNDPVEVNLQSMLPEKLANVVLGATKGEDFGAGSWVEIAPNSITVGPRQERKIRVMMSLPDGSTRPYYYATVMAHAKLNGVAVGSTPVLVAIKNTGATAQPALSPGGPVMLSMGEKNMVTVSAAFTNTGDVHLSPNVRFAVKKDALGDSLLSVTAEPESPIALPVSTNRYNGVFDVSKLAPGSYVLTAMAEFGGKTTSASTGFKVVKTKTGVTVEMIKAPAATKGKG
ncbi:MAG: hypothetical protein ACAH95_04300 [Fimbriimonas sp.]